MTDSDGTWHFCWAGGSSGREGRSQKTAHQHQAPVKWGRAEMNLGGQPVSPTDRRTPCVPAEAVL